MMNKSRHIPPAEFLPFEALDIHLLYEILHLRAKVFVVEQNCAYQDLDYRDQHSLHVLLRRHGRLAAYARIILPQTADEPVRIGRVLTEPAFRRQGLAESMMQQIMTYIRRHHPDRSVELSAQTYLTAFYEKFGFRRRGHEYLEDGIPHVRMVWEGE